MSQRANILLVDDEERNLDTLEAVLTPSEDYQTLRATDANVALRALLEQTIALVILDIRMPNVDGIELARLIKGTKRFRDVPILFLTAHMLDETDVLAGYGVGAVDYLTKPFNPQILRQKVSVFVELFKKTHALAELNATLEQRVLERTAELERSEHALREAGRQKDEFLATLAHELRNPLAPLRTGLDLFKQLQDLSTPPAKRTLGAMDRQLDHIIRLIDDLLDVSRISRGVLELKRERTNLGQVTESAEEIFRPLLQLHDITLEVNSARDVWADVDATRISQIIGNLLHNASKFTARRGVVRVSLSFQPSGAPEGRGTAVIRVSDTGVGIPADRIEHVFDMFAQFSGPPGVGIGLALAKRLALLHGGDLVAESAGEGRGATFTLTLPNAVRAAPEARAHALRRREAGAPLQIVLIEDNKDVADTLASWLEAMGHRVTVARTGRAGLELVIETRPELVLCDVGLPEMDGLEVCQRVRELALERPPMMVALTGWGKDEDRKRTRSAGFDHHLVKPVALDVLSDVIAHAGG